jgi:hypothetical protein
MLGKVLDLMPLSPDPQKIIQKNFQLLKARPWRKKAKKKTTMKLT